jgi:large subunit ribosomal protein L25
MAAIKQLAAAARTGTGKGAARSVRRESRVPAVIYGGGEAPQPISLDYKTINQLIYAGRFLTTIFEIDVDGKVERVVPRDYQLDVVRDTPMHVDFLRLRSGTKLRVSVPVHMSGADVSPGIKLGGTLNVVRHQIDLRVPAENIPDSVAVDISQMGIGDSLHVSAVTLPEGCTPIITDRDFTIATIAPPVKVEEAPAAAPAAPAKGKK